jgi:ACR3 family arsenite efflux pump ArsB
MLHGSDLHLVSGIFKELSILDRLLTPLILVCMIVGVLIGNYVSGVQEAFDTVRLNEVSVRMWTIFSSCYHCY